MKKLVVKINPFQRKQLIYIYDSEETIVPSVETDLEKLNITISQLAQSEGVRRVDFAGPKSFALGMKRELESIQKRLYNNENNLEINII